MNTKLISNSAYRSYLRWSFTTNVLYSIENVICYQGFMSTMNFQENNSIMIYYGKDIVGQIGSLWYIYNYSSKMDTHSSRMLVKSLVFQQMSLVCIYNSMIDLYLIGYIPMIISGIGSFLSNISFVGYGAVSTRYMVSIVDQNSIGEAYSITTVVNTLASSIGTIIGLSYSFIDKNNYLTSFLLDL